MAIDFKLADAELKAVEPLAEATFSAWWKSEGQHQTAYPSVSTKDAVYYQNDWTTNNETWLMHKGPDGQVTKIKPIHVTFSYDYSNWLTKDQADALTAKVNTAIPPKYAAGGNLYAQGSTVSYDWSTFYGTIETALPRPAVPTLPWSEQMFPEVIEVSVTAADIRDGRPRDGRGCAISRAVSRRFDGIDVRTGSSHLTFDRYGAQYRCEDPQTMGQFIWKFDRNMTVEPTTLRFRRIN